MNGIFTVCLLASSACAFSLPSLPSLPNPLTALSGAKDAVSTVFTDVILTHVVPLGFLENVTLPAQLEFYQTFLNADITKGAKHDALTAWAAKNGVETEMAESYDTYNANMHEVNATLVEMLDEMPAIVDKIFEIFCADPSILNNLGPEMKALLTSITPSASAAITKISDLLGFPVAPGLVAYVLSAAGGAVNIDGSKFFDYTDVDRLFDLRYLSKVSPAEANKAKAILTDTSLANGEVEKQLAAWAAKNGVSEDAKKSTEAYHQKMDQAKQVSLDFIDRLKTQYLPSLGETFASQTISQSETAKELGAGLEVVGKDAFEVYMKSASLLGLKPPLGPPAPPTLPKLPGALGKIFG